MAGNERNERSTNIGYTHYYSVGNWTSKDADGYNNALPILRKVAEKYKSIIHYECDDDRQARVDSMGIHLNGIGGEGHETFAFKPGSTTRDFCKTAEKPYDLPVCEMLLVLKAHLPNFELRSDGFNGMASNPKIDGAWGAAIENVKAYGIYYKIVVGSQGPGREHYCTITPVFDRFESAVAAGMDQKPGKRKMKKPSKKEILAALENLLNAITMNGTYEDVERSYGKEVREATEIAHNTFARNYAKSK